jgi:integrase/recombinase XerD
MTARNYLSQLRWLFQYYPDTKPSQLTRQMTIDYLVYCAKTLGSSKVKMKMAANAFAFFFRQALNQPYELPSILFKAHSAKLPTVMSPEEVMAIINSIDNTKHRAIISLLYSTGMRLSEVASLKLADIDSKAMRIKVVSGKGDKDRFTILSESMLLELRAYWLVYRPSVYLFNGPEKGKKYTARSIQHILGKALIRVGLAGKHYTIHTFRHSFATHLLNQGTDLLTIKALLGHANMAQTMQYLHLSEKHIRDVISPYDLLLDIGSKRLKTKSSW